MIRKMACTGILVILVVCVSMTALFAFIQAGGIHAAGVGEKNVILVAAHDSPEAAKVLADYTCDGIADQVEIQQAIDASRARGAAVSLAEGTFNLDGDLVVPGNTLIEGKGETRTRLHWMSGRLTAYGGENIVLGNFETCGTGAIFLFNCSHVRVHDVVARVDDSLGGGAFFVWVQNSISEDIEFVNCKAIDCGRMGFMNDGEGSPRLIRNIRYINCQAINSGRYARFTPYGEWTTGFAIAENNDLADAMLTACLAEGSFESGFHVENAPRITNLVFRDCISRNNGQKPDAFYNPSEESHGLHFGSGYWVQGGTTLYNCVSGGNGNAGFSAGPGVRLYNCTDDGSAVGFRLVETRDVYLKDCTSRNAGAYAVYALEAEGIVAEGLNILDPAGFNGNGSFFGTIAHPVINSRFDLIGQNDGTVRTIYCEGCRGVTFTGVIRTGHPDPVVITRGEGIDTRGLQIEAGGEIADPGRDGGCGLKNFLIRIITAFL
ncbi:MAG: hypothetical protein KA818_02730 [Methanoculleus sp.]|jgi:hypothetical protein|nr:hypothetical protein [Methanoculleus sp.]